eukprot:6547861-Pyramimonas_sp.AAC.1
MASWRLTSDAYSVRRRTVFEARPLALCTKRRRLWRLARRVALVLLAALGLLLAVALAARRALLLSQAAAVEEALRLLPPWVPMPLAWMAAWRLARVRRR